MFSFRLEVQVPCTIALMITFNFFRVKPLKGLEYQVNSSCIQLTLKFFQGNFRKVEKPEVVNIGIWDCKKPGMDSELF